MKVQNIQWRQYRALLLVIIMVVTMAGACSKDLLVAAVRATHNPFGYDLGLKVLPSKQSAARVMVCCHGYGHSNAIADVIRSMKVTSNHLVSFNFPDYQIRESDDHANTSFGTIDEIVPLLFVLKRLVVAMPLASLTLYGFSAGGGAVVNALALLYFPEYHDSLERFGISLDDLRAIRTALEAGCVLLDCPLKSVEEVMEVAGTSKNLAHVAAAFAKNNSRPIDVVGRLHDLQLNIILHFQQPDEILGNRDDHLFIERLRRANKGTTVVTLGYDGGHNSKHKELWQAYAQQAKC